MIRLAGLSLFILIALASSSVIAQDGPSKEIPELAILSKYIGKWDVAIAATERSPATKGETTAEWILDGTHVQRTGFLSDDKGVPYIKILEMITYDQRKKTYRMWTFSSRLGAWESLGKFDDSTDTLTWVHAADSVTATTAVTFEDGPIVKWSVSVTDKDGAVRPSSSGVNTRRDK